MRRVTGFAALSFLACAAGLQPQPARANCWECRCSFTNQDGSPALGSTVVAQDCGTACGAASSPSASAGANSSRQGYSTESYVIMRPLYGSACPGDED